MSSITVVTCFTYHKTRKYTFNPIHLRSDLRSSLVFSYNKVGSTFKDTYVLTDMVPQRTLVVEINNEFQAQVINAMAKRGITIEKNPLNRRPIQWIEKVIKDKRLRDEILTNILPVLTAQSSVEFACLFTNFSLICGKEDYHNTLQSIFKRDISKLFFYYSGHGIRGITLNMAIPAKNNETQYYTSKQLQKSFELIKQADKVIVFDCCYGERFIEYPYRFGSGWQKRSTSTSNGPKSIFISSTKWDQTCGFYDDGKIHNSLFTYHFLKHVNSNVKELSELMEVEKRVLEYRKRVNKTPQNICILLTNPTIDRLPDWLFKGQRRQIIER